MPSNPPIIAPAVAPTQFDSPFIFIGEADFIIPYSTAVTFWVSLVLTLVGEVFEQEYRKIIETINPTSENNQFGLEIAFAYISNKNYIEAIKWINLFENSNVKNEKIEYAKFLIDLNETNQLDTIIKYISKNYENLNTINDQKTLESIDQSIKKDGWVHL